MKCFLKARRGTRGGLVNINFTWYGNVKDAMSHIELLYRSKFQGSYQPYILNMDVDVCKIGQYLNLNEMVKRVVAVMIKHNNAIVKGCPLQVCWVSRGVNGSIS